MLSREESEILTRVGPEAPMGRVLRRYWTPAFLAGDLPEPDCSPIGVTVLGEDFVAFRDSSGRLGFLDELCCHRGAPLSYGRVEEGGIRCLYHGWKYDTEGRLLETPNCENPHVMERVRQGSYPVREAGGMGWVYLGPKEHEPPFPHFAYMDAPAEEISVSEQVYDCNWIQVQEGSLDSSHIGILHMDNGIVARPLPRRVGSLEIGGIPWDDVRRPYSEGVPSDDNAPAIHVADTPYGFMYAAVRRMDDPTKKHVRITSLTFPYTGHIAGSGSSGALFVVPRDDETCSFISASGVGRRRTQSAVSATDLQVDGVREIRFPQDARYYRVTGQDRAAMAARRSYAGFREGNRPQDASVQGVNAKRRIYSRATEHLVEADAACLRFRRLLLESLERIDSGQPPLGLGEGYDFRDIQGYSGVADINAGWEDLVPKNLAKGPLPVRQEASGRVASTRA
jgi:phthalate 4,5-dioxygenase oxygenase subunit